MNPRIALDQMALLRDRLTGREYHTYMTMFMIDVARKQNGPVWSDDDGQPSGWVFCHNERARLDMAEVFYISTDMTTLVRWAASSLEDLDRFSRDLWPVDHGFVWLEDGLPGIDMWGKTIRMRAFTWARHNARMSDGGWSHGMSITMYSDLDDDRDDITQEIRQATGEAFRAELGRLQVMHTLFIADDQRIGPATVSLSAARREFLSQWSDDGTEPSGEASNDERFILAYLMMMTQTVTAVNRHEVDRQAAKRFRRMGLPHQVTVVELRRHAGARGEGETAVEWAHRWIVRGHWRSQPYKDGDGVVYKRIWIAPYVKGPDGKPFVQSTKVYALTR